MWRGAEDINYGIAYILTFEVRNIGVQIIKRSPGRNNAATRKRDFGVDHTWTYGLKENISPKPEIQKLKTLISEVN